MSESLSALLYLVASVCFIMALRGLSSPDTARAGNIYGIAGMAIAILTTLVTPQIVSYWLIIVGLLIGGAIGTYIAREMDEEFQRRQREKVTEALRRTDIVICTALIPGRRAPVLLTGEMVAGMAPGSVIVDLAVEAGGNVEGSRPGEVVGTANGAKILGHLNVPSRIAVDASQLYARNLLAFLALLVDKEGRLRIDTSDEIVKAALLTLDGAVINPALMPEPAVAPSTVGATPGANS